LVYTLASGASPRKWVGVQVPLRAQKLSKLYRLAGSSEEIPLEKSCSRQQINNDSGIYTALFKAVYCVI
jgi:hypothetical protein